METKQEQERYLIQFREERYNERLKYYEKYQRQCEELRQFIKEEIEIEVDDLNIKGNNLFEIVVERFTKKYEKQNTLGLKPMKLAELLEVNLPGIRTEIDNLRNNNEVRHEPDIEKFCLYVYDQDKIEMAKKCQKIIDMLNEVGMSAITINSPDSPIYKDLLTLKLNPRYFGEPNISRP